MRSTMRVVVIVIGVLIALALLFLLLQALVTDPAKAADKKATYYDGIAYADPVLIEEPQTISTDPTYEKKGCANSTVRGKIETAVVGWDVMNAQLWQYYCWKEGHITYLGDLRKQMDVTTWGNAHGWREDGWRDGPNGWTNYGDKYHGGHYAVKTAKFKACVPFPTGCVDSNSATIRLSLLQHAGGRWWGSVGK